MGFCRVFGIRHVQIILMSILIFLDVLFIESMRSTFTMGREGLLLKGDFAKYSRTFTDDQRWLMEMTSFISYAVGRSISPFFIFPLNNKYLLLGSVIVELIGSWFVRLVVVHVHFLGLIVAVVVVMVCQSIHYPIAFNIMAKWIPPSEYTRCCVVIAAGDVFARNLVSLVAHSSVPGITVSLTTSAVSLKMVWCLAFFIVGAQTPQTSFLIQNHEWRFLCKTVGPRRKIDCTLNIPWRSIFTTAALYGLIFSECAHKWFFVITLDLRMLAPEINHFGLDIAMFFQPILSFYCAWFIDWVITRDYVSANNARKISATISFWGTAFSLAFVGYYHKKTALVSVFFGFARYLSAFVELCITPTVFDLSPNYATVLFCMYMIPSWASIGARSYVDRKFKMAASVADSLPVIYRAALLLYIFNFGFLLLGRIGLQKFDSYDTYDWRKESVISYP